MLSKEVKHLHIIDLEVPYPVDYGGVYDLFYKLPYLQQEGVQIHLHCFTRDRKPQPILNQYCASVHYYQRNTGLKSITKVEPYIVASRQCEELTQRLLQDDYPILMEGVHCTAITNDTRFKHRRLFVRLHNVEHHYYEQLHANSNNFLKKLFFKNESRLLEKYETALINKATAFWTVTRSDEWYFRNKLNCKTVDYLPLFIPPWQLIPQRGMGTYCLYQANLEVPENDVVAHWLLDEVFSKIETPLVIAGKNPSAALEEKAHKHIHTCLVANPTEQQMQEMIAKAHINVLPSFSKTGIKIKLLNALYNGRHCVVNKNMVNGLGVDATCTIAEDANAMIELLPRLFELPFDENDFQKRKICMENQFNNTNSARQMVAWIWDKYNR